MAAPDEKDDDDTSSSSGSSSSSHSNIKQQETTLILSFESLEDVQTRLVLLPRIEEEGVGAVVEQFEKAKTTTITTTTKTMGDDSDKHNDDDSSSMELMRGSILLGICSKQQEQDEVVLQNDLKDQDFASILAAIRSAPTPILLQFIKPPPPTTTTTTTLAPTADATAANANPAAASSSSCSCYADDKKMSDPGDHTDTTALEEDEEEASSSTCSDTHEENHLGSTANNTTPTLSLAAAAPVTTATTLPQQSQSVQKFMSWASSRISTATSVAQLAAETSCSLQSAVVETATAAIASRKRIIASSSSSTLPTTASTAAVIGMTELGLYLQVPTSGDFIPLAASSSSSFSSSSCNNNAITNSSLLLIRKFPSAEPCPVLDSCGGEYSYQWYRSSGDRCCKQQKQQHAIGSSTVVSAAVPSASTTFVSSSLPSFVSSSMGQHYFYNSNCNTYNNNQHSGNEQHNWTLLPGATRAAFQPTATEVGHWLRCIVRIRKPRHNNHHHQVNDNDVNEKNANQHDCSGSSSSSSSKSANEDKNDEVIILETRERVSAALALFNGSRQALVRGAQFGGLVGRGNAEGRQFRIKVAMTTCDTNMKKRNATARVVRRGAVTSAVTIYQVSGSTAEPMHPENEPIACVSAVADHDEPKALELTFPKGLPESAKLVEALTTDGRFQIAASNRLGRESLLLAIGIANFDGKPVDLDANMVLFDDDDNDDGDGDDDAHRSLIASSSGSSTGGISNTSDSLDCFHGIPPLSPANSAPVTPCRGGDQISMLEPQQRSHSFDTGQVIVDFASPVAAAMQSSRISELEKELQFLRGKLARKDKAFSELQRHVAQSEASRGQLQQQVSRSQEELNDSKSKLCAAEKRAESVNDELLGIRNEHAVQISSLESKLASQSDKIVELEKSVRTLQNEKALLSASVEARESKLSKMTVLQTSFDQLSQRVSESDALRAELEEANKKRKENTILLQKLSLSEQDRRSELERTKQEIAVLASKLEQEQARTGSCRSELEAQQMKIQKLKAERNSFKQKGDSLAKEIAKVCRNGRTIKDVEKIILDDASRKQEVTLLREQKRKALDEIQQYRTALEQCRSAQKMAGLDHDSTRVLERNAELERLLSELTEYIAAKEQQVGTLKLVNDELQAEVIALTKANMCKNLGKNDV